MTRLKPLTIARIVALVHVAVIVTGAALPVVFLIYPRLSWLVVSFVVLIFLQWALMRGCSLTMLERRYRLRYDPDSDFEHQSFIQFYVKKLLGMTVGRRAIRGVVAAYLLMTVLLVVLG